MLEISIDNCQYFWINRRDLEIESKRNTTNLEVLKLK